MRDDMRPFLTYTRSRGPARVAEGEMKWRAAERINLWGSGERIR